MNLRSLLRQPLLTIAFHEREMRWTVGTPRRVVASGEVPLPPGLVSDGVNNDSAAAGLLMRDAQGFPGSSRMQVVVAVPAQRSVFRQIDVPAVRGKQFDELALREIRREMPMLAENAHISWQRVGEKDGKVAVFVVGVARDVLESHVAAVRAAGLHPLSADLRVIAAARSFGAPDAIIANVEEAEIEIGIFRNGVPAIVRFVPMATAGDTDAWGDQLAAELARTLKFYRDSHRNDDGFDDIPVSFVGGAARDAVLIEQVATSTGHQVAMPPLRLSLEPEDRTIRFAANIGLAIKDLAA